MSRKQNKKKHKLTRKREKKQKLRHDRKREEKLSSQQGRTRTRTAVIRFPFNVGNELRTGVQYHQSGQLEKAEKIYKEILENNPDHPRALYLLGGIAYQVGKNAAAVNLINKAIQNDPENALYYKTLGNAFLSQGNSDKAIACFQKALELRPDYGEAHINLGNAFKDQGKLSEAISCYHKALQLRPDYAEACMNMGFAFQDQGKSNEAIACYRKAVQLKPDLAQAYYSMGNVFQHQGRLNEAISCYDKALHLRPDHAEAHTYLGNAFKDQGKLSEAIPCYHKALQLRPDYAEACMNMGLAFQWQDRWDEAADCCRKAIEMKPDYVEAYSHLFHQLQNTCAWHKMEGLTAKLDDLTKKALDNGTEPAEAPFISFARHADLSRNFAVAKSWSCHIAKTMSNLKTDFSFDDRRSCKTRIAVGYLSSDFRDHATAHLMLSLFGLHNRHEFEILCYSYGEDDGSYYRERIHRDCDKFVDLSNPGYAVAAECIYEDQVDILVDLKGYTKGSMLGICALRPAPIQVSYLGFPGTTADFYDYIITDRIVTPEEHACYYIENLAYLPHCYQVNDHTQSISNKGWKKADVGLPEGSFVFCSFNRGYKIDPVMFDVWMKILRQVPEGVLWLQWANKTAEKNLRQEAEAKGVEAERLFFAEQLPKAEHLARMRLADLALDTRIVNGHTTTSDALWAGVPVITLMGSHFASRVSASILTAIGLPELITDSLEDYEALAVRLARDPGELQAIRQRLAKNRLTEPLFDTPRFTRNLEKAYKEMWKIFLAGEKPRQIEAVET